MGNYRASHSRQKIHLPALNSTINLSCSSSQAYILKSPKARDIEKSDDFSYFSMEVKKFPLLEDR